ncbi:MotA/TolQ/ExbB proton channel family protein [Natronospira bacteriovora]|uniref:MotA/TolQ/ExbB proton channel family protein n=1 Tax=Natronospira bacteriovora TaxID=3069753 RepID=A0ABU0W611_9GAMM|nr:MotA/TolQ/ExbB proton channel family protein [Natronospira sp. AB-CW4]MDQ2069470.1 MotA/TolQ/ExbB proton channel family protein [Natronospira sp. AB-CW4]
MIWIAESFAALRDFFEAGGDVLWAILVVTIMLWTLILERLWYFRMIQPAKTRKALEAWNNMSDHDSWYARQIREQLLSEIRVDSGQFIFYIKTMVAVLPLLGLLGTVTGMIQVFDVMTVLGTGNPRAMAGGVSAATIPTMSGMVAALSGLYFGASLDKRAKVEVERAADLLRYH